MDRITNVAMFAMAPGYGRYAAFCAEAGIDDDNATPMTIDATMVSDNEEEGNNQSIPTYRPEVKITKPPSQTTEPGTVDLDWEPTAEGQPTSIVDDNKDKQMSNASVEFLKYHLKFNHCPPKKIQLMACLLYTSPSPRDGATSRMPSSA